MAKARPPYTVDAAAKELGLAVKTVYGWLNEGKLEEAPVEGKITLITSVSVQRAKRGIEKARAAKAEVIQ